MAEQNTVTKLPVPERLSIMFQFPDGRLVEEAVVRPLSFVGFVDCVTATSNMTQPKSFEARLRRLRLLKQVQFFSGGSPIMVSQEDVLQIPIPAARQLLLKLDEDEAPAGKIIRPGNGVDQAVGFELGTPIPVGQNKPPIKELEFLARTYGDVEDIMAATDAATQTKLLIETIAKPIGTSLSTLPSWAVNHITISDGFIVMREILPHFLGSPTE